MSNEQSWANGIDFNNLPVSSHRADDLGYLLTAKVGDLVVSLKTSRVNPITKVTKKFVWAFGIQYRRDNGEEYGRRNGHTFGRGIIPLTTRTRDAIVFRDWPELKPVPQPDIEVIDIVIIGDDIYKVIREGDSAYIEYNGNLLSYFAGIDNAQHVFNRITLEAAEDVETTIGGPGVSIPLDEITF